MPKAETAIAYLDGQRLVRALNAGFRHVFQRREYINRINVFPVPDGDTGTNMAFTFRTIQDAVLNLGDVRVDELMRCVADAALDGARGNSGAIMAQFFEGFSEAVEGRRLLDADSLASAAAAGARSAWKAMAEPVAGALPSVLDGFADGLAKGASPSGGNDIQARLGVGIEAAQKALEHTPEQLPVLKAAGVVDAGGQGFVDLLDGIWAYVTTGSLDDEVQGDMEPLAVDHLSDLDIGEHRYCTECVIEGEGMDREVIMQSMGALDCSSLVVAGSSRRIRVHIHVNNPAEVFLAGEAFGEITRQKADDMQRQHGLLNQPGRVAVVTDSGADLPEAEIERLGIHIVPVRLSFGEREFLDGVSIDSEQFYEMLEQSPEFPKTSQPPPQDFRRTFALLGSHGYEVLEVGLTSQLSGTTGAAISAAERTDGTQVVVFDTLNASSGQGLLVLAAAEAAAQGMESAEIEALLHELRPVTRIFAQADNLSSAVRGGRVPVWMKRITEWLRLNPVLTATPEGKLGLAGFCTGRGVNPVQLARRVVKAMDPEQTYRIMIAHARDAQGARAVRRAVLAGHGRVHSCLLAEAGPALGAHLGKGGLIVAVMPNPDVLGAHGMAA